MYKNDKIKLSVLFLKENDAWVGQCLEHDIVAQGKTFEAAKTALNHTIAAQMLLDDRHNNDLLANIKPAPASYWERFKTAERLRYTIELSPQFEAEVRVALEIDTPATDEPASE